MNLMELKEPLPSQNTISHSGSNIFIPYPFPARASRIRVFVTSLDGGSITILSSQIMAIGSFQCSALPKGQNQSENPLVKHFNPEIPRPSFLLGATLMVFCDAQGQSALSAQQLRSRFGKQIQTVFYWALFHPSSNTNCAFAYFLHEKIRCLSLYVN